MGKLVFDVDTYIKDSIEEDSLDIDIHIISRSGANCWMFEAQGLAPDETKYMLHPDWLCPIEQYKPYTAREFVARWAEVRKEYVNPTKSELS